MTRVLPSKGIPIGQLIFDPAGEYANVNVQDRTALAEIGAEHVTRFRLGATDVELTAEPDLRPLALNFFDEELMPSPGASWVSSYGASVTPTSQVLRRGRRSRAPPTPSSRGVEAGSVTRGERERWRSHAC